MHVLLSHKNWSCQPSQFRKFFRWLVRSGITDLHGVQKEKEEIEFFFPKGHTSEVSHPARKHSLLKIIQTFMFKHMPTHVNYIQN